jgi:hypothetical protein
LEKSRYPKQVKSSDRRKGSALSGVQILFAATEYTYGTMPFSVHRTALQLRLAALAVSNAVQNADGSNLPPPSWKKSAGHGIISPFT